MAAIKGQNTKPEIVLRSELFKRGYRFRIHRKDLPGKPDIVLPKFKTAIFVHGCFWHQHSNCKHGHLPKSNISYWLPKLKRNVERHTHCDEELKKIGWQPLVVWECDIKKDVAAVVRNIEMTLLTI